MKSFISLLFSEFYKNKNTNLYWAIIALPLSLIGIVTFGFFSKRNVLSHIDGVHIWNHYIGSVIRFMGALILPLFVTYVSFAVNHVEHKASMWKSLLSLPVSRIKVYTAKSLFAILIIAGCLLLFSVMLILGGELLYYLDPKNLRFGEVNYANSIFLIFVKLFLSCLGILSVQFLLSLIWSDFIKPIGTGFIVTLIGLILNSSSWKYAFLIPHALPLIVLRSVSPTKSGSIEVNLLDREIITSLLYLIIFFFLGYYFFRKKELIIH